jgi:metallo-beta-lactamase family protein
MLADTLGFTDWSDKEQARILARIQEITWGFEYDRDFDLVGGLRFRLGQSGHILGSCFVRIEAKGDRDGLASVVFSGDLGPPNTPILPDPAVPAACDLLVMESTYGDRRRHAERGEARVQRLGEVLSGAIQDQGKVLIPAFSLGRTQELLYEMDRLFSDPVWQARFPDLASRGRPPVFLDSPLALDITRVYAQHTANWDCETRELLEAGDAPLDFHGLYAVRSHRDHQKLLAYDGPAVILAGSGMCTGGRIVNHLRQDLEDPRNDVLFVGYQAPGTPGRDLMAYGGRPDGYVVLDGELVGIRARVHVLTGYSAHADQEDLVQWARAAGAARITLVHGEGRAREALQKRLAG